MVAAFSKLVFCAVLFASPGVHATPIPLASDPSETTYDEVRGFLQDTVARHPDTTRLLDLGVTDSGERLQGLAMGSGPVHNLVVAAHHGNEYGSAEVAMAFAESVAANPIAGQTVYVIPVLNILGFNGRNRYETSSNGGRYDPNRNYPGPCGTEGPFTLKSTRLLAGLIDRENIVASATLHTFYPAVVYPWGLGAVDLSTPYDALFKGLVEAATHESGYQVGNSTEVIYSADGTFEDYAFWKHGIWSILFELGNSHYPSQGDIAEMVAKNLPGLRLMFETAPQTRAVEHAFTSKCSRNLNRPDRHDE